MGLPLLSIKGPPNSRKMKIEFVLDQILTFTATAKIAFHGKITCLCTLYNHYLKAILTHFFEQTKEILIYEAARSCGHLKR
jgi:hypothetical protein